MGDLPGVSRRNCLAGGAAAALFGPTFAAAAIPGGVDASAIDAAAKAAIGAGACPGVAVGIWRKGTPLLEKGYGLANLEMGAAVAPDSVFRVGSLTKQFTAALILKLAGEHRLGLDEPASRFLPVFKAAAPFTLRQLLNQTAGLHSDETEGSPPSGSRRPKSQIELAAEIALQRQLFDFAPGTAWLYSNANYVVLGAVAEAVTGSTLAEAAAEKIFRPLGLADTRFDTSDAAVPRRALGYTPVEGKSGEFEPAGFIQISDAGGAGAMRSTVTDLCRWHHALFSARLLDRPQLETMIAPGRLVDGRLSGANRFSPEDSHYGAVQYAMGFLVDPTAARRSVLHYGAIDGFAACLETFIDEGLTTAILCNGDIGPDTPFRSMRRVVAASGEQWNS